MKNIKAILGMIFIPLIGMTLFSCMNDKESVSEAETSQTVEEVMGEAPVTTEPAIMEPEETLTDDLTPAATGESDSLELEEEVPANDNEAEDLTLEL